MDNTVENYDTSIRSKDMKTLVDIGAFLSYPEWSFCKFDYFTDTDQGSEPDPTMSFKVLQKLGADETIEEEDEPFGGPRPIVPFSSLFIFSSRNP